MRRILLRVAYDGTNYSGWQLQPNGTTIEEQLNTALTALTGVPIQVIGAGRTDAGVHSLGNVAVFDTESKIPADKFAFALNARLPEDIRVQESTEVSADFHPRKQNSRKTYVYKILNRTFELPLHRHDTYFFHGDLDLAAMQAAGNLLMGEHDFGAFCSAGSQAADTIRRIYALTVTREEDIISIRVTGNGFLYNMVRIIAGTLLEVGCGHLTVTDVQQMLLTRQRSDAGRKVPAKGLTMVGIAYLPEEFPQIIDSDTWHYELYRQEDRIFLYMKQCDRTEDYDVLMGKLIHHAYRDGAAGVYVCGNRSAEATGTITAGDRVGHFLLEETAEPLDFLGKEWLLAKDCYLGEKNI